MPKGIPLTDDEQARRRGEIFAALLRLFRARGLGAVSMREVAEAAGVGKSTIYDYFSSRDEMLLWALEQALGGLVQTAAAARPGAGSAAARLRQLLRLYDAFLAADEGVNAQLLAAAASLGAEGRARARVCFDPLAALFAETIAVGIRAGHFRPVDPGLAARGLLVWIDLGLSAPLTLAELDSLLDLFLDGLHKPVPGTWKSERRSLWKGG